LSVLIAAALALPVLVVGASFFGGLSENWSHLAATALPRYVGNTLLLLLAVACGVVSMGVVSAWLITAYRFPGRGLLEWALLLPLAVPAYVMAYAYTDWLQFTGPVHSAARR
jgi:iron(III) transport system permease protein